MLRMVEVKEATQTVARVGNKPIPVPPAVQVTISPGNTVHVKGPRGELTHALHPEMLITLADGVLRVGRPSEERRHKALHGLTRALLNNMVMGVTQGYERALELVGTGYRAQQAGKKVVLQVGYSHPVEVETPPGITITVQSPIRLVVSGCDKQQVGQMAAIIRAIKPPDHYKGKGVRYAGEVVHLKPGKAAARKQQQ